MSSFESDDRDPQIIVWDARIVRGMRDIVADALSEGTRLRRMVFGIARHRLERTLATLNTLLDQAQQGWIVAEFPRRTIDELGGLWNAARRRLERR